MLQYCYQMLGAATGGWQPDAMLFGYRGDYRVEGKTKRLSHNRCA